MMNVLFNISYHLIIKVFHDYFFHRNSKTEKITKINNSRTDPIKYFLFRVNRKFNCPRVKNYFNAMI